MPANPTASEIASAVADKVTSTFLERYPPDSSSLERSLQKTLAGATYEPTKKHLEAQLKMLADSGTAAHAGISGDIWTWLLFSSSQFQKDLGLLMGQIPETSSKEVSPEISRELVAKGAEQIEIGENIEREAIEGYHEAHRKLNAEFEIDKRLQEVDLSDTQAGDPFDWLRESITGNMLDTARASENLICKKILNDSFNKPKEEAEHELRVLLRAAMMKFTEFTNLQDSSAYLSTQEEEWSAPDSTG